MSFIDSVQDLQNIAQIEATTTILPPASNFNMTLSQRPTFGNVLAYAQQGDANIFLYDVADLTILLSIPQSMNISFQTKENIKHSGTRKFNTIHGERDGFLFYKNNQTHLDKIDQMFPGSNWRSQLSSPLPAVKSPSEPVLMMRATVYHNGENVPASLYEYNEKQLVVFSARDLAGDKNILSWWSRYVCPEATSGYSDGYGAWKNNPRAINFLKQIFKFPELETKYVKSQPVMSSPPSQSTSHNHFIIDKQVMFGPTSHQLDVVEISPLAVTIFFDPPIGIQGFEQQWKQDLKHPVKGKFPGFLIPKSRTDMLSWIQSNFGLDDFESKYLMNREENERETGIPKTPQQLTEQSTAQSTASALSNMTLNNMSDIPIATLLRLLTEKINQTNFYNKSTIDGKVIIFGKKEEVVETASNLDEMSTELEVHFGDKQLVMLK